jgi:hypothetical protein
MLFNILKKITIYYNKTIKNQQLVNKFLRSIIRLKMNILIQILYMKMNKIVYFFKNKVKNTRNI